MRGIALLSVVFLIGRASCLPNPQNDGGTVADHVLPTADFGEKDPREETVGQFADPDAALQAELLAGLDSDAISNGCPYKVKVGRTKGTNDNKGPYKLLENYYGTYTIQNGLIGGKNWFAGSGSRSDKAIWYYEAQGRWIVGLKNNVYTGTGWFSSLDDDDCPDTIYYTWKYYVPAIDDWVDAGKSMAIWEY